MAEITTPINFAKIMKQNDCSEMYSSENPRNNYQMNNNYSNSGRSSYNSKGGRYQ